MSWFYSSRVVCLALVLCFSRCFNHKRPLPLLRSCLPLHFWSCCCFFRVGFFRISIFRVGFRDLLHCHPPRSEPPELPQSWVSASLAPIVQRSHLGPTRTYVLWFYNWMPPHIGNHPWPRDWWRIVPLYKVTTGLAEKTTRPLKVR